MDKKLSKKEQGNGMILVETTNEFALVSSKEILGPFFITKSNDNEEFQVSKPIKTLLKEELELIQHELLIREEGVSHG